MRGGWTQPPESCTFLQERFVRPVLFIFFIHITDSRQRTVFGTLKNTLILSSQRGFNTTLFKKRNLNWNIVLKKEVLTTFKKEDNKKVQERYFASKNFLVVFTLIESLFKHETHEGDTEEETNGYVVFKQDISSNQLENRERLTTGF
jgi:hypothetical protein